MVLLVKAAGHAKHLLYKILSTEMMLVKILSTDMMLYKILSTDMMLYKILSTEMLLCFFKRLQTIPIHEGKDQAGKIMCQCKQYSPRQTYCSMQQGTLQQVHIEQDEPLESRMTTLQLSIVSCMQAPRLSKSCHATRLE